jgi:ParB-like chromosome segregation protein Spo0J
MAEVLPHRYAMVATADVHPHPRNARLGDVDAIAESIEALGFFGVIVVHEQTGDILIGSHRYLAAQQSGIAELPALLVDCDDATARRIMLADNAIGDLATWDVDALVDELQQLAAEPGALLTGTGFSVDQLADMLRRQAAPPGFPEHGAGDPTDFCCPSCGYEWSGQAKPPGIAAAS